MRHHFCGHAVKAAVERLFASNGCYPSYAVPIAECILIIGLSISVAYRHRQSLFSSKKASKSDGAKTKKFCIVPWEALILAAVTGTHWLSGVYVPLIKATLEKPEEVLGGFNLNDTFTMVMFAYFAIIEMIENRSFKKYVLKAYYDKKTVLPVVSAAAESYTDEKEALMKTDADVADEESTPMLKQDTEEEQAAAPVRRCRFLGRIRARLEKSRKREIALLSPTNITARYHSRALSKVVLTAVFLWQSIFEICSLEPADYFNAEVTALPMMVGVATFCFVRFLHVVVGGMKFAKREGL